MVFGQYFVSVLLNSQANIFRKESDEGPSKLNIIELLGPSTCFEKKKIMNFFLEKLVVSNIRSCLPTLLNQNRKYEITTSETVVVRYKASVFFALNMGKTSAVGEI